MRMSVSDLLGSSEHCTPRLIGSWDFEMLSSRGRCIQGVSSLRFDNEIKSGGEAPQLTSNSCVTMLFRYLDENSEGFVRVKVSM